MYDELIKRLRHLAKVYSICGNENTNEYRLAIEAADAIEELQKRVPKTPHGRLIDADAFEYTCKFNYCNGCEDWNGLKCKTCWVDDMLGKLDFAPTIIESEGEDDSPSH